MDASVVHQPFQRHLRDFPAQWVEARNDHRFGCFVNNQIDPGGRFDRTDVAAFPADDASLHGVIGNRNDGNCRFGHIVAYDSLYGGRDDLSGFALCILSGFLQRPFRNTSGVEARLALHFLEQIFLGFLGGHARNTLQGLAVLSLSLGAGRFLGDELFFLSHQFLFAPLAVGIALVQDADAFVDGFLALNQTLFGGRQFQELGFLFLFEFRFGLEDQVLGLELGFLNDIFGFPLRVLDRLPSLFFILGTLGVYQHTAHQ